MANDLIVRVLGETSQFEKSLKTATATTTAFDRTLKKSAVTAEQSAQAQIAASVKKDARLREEIALYRQIASAAERGSREQVVASNLAERAERQLARSMGVTATEARTLSASTQHFERDLGRATRGALAGSGIFRNLGRSIVFASGGFLAFGGAAAFLRTSIDAAKEAQVTEAQLGKQFEANHRSLEPYRAQIDRTANSLSALSGFENDELKAALVTILRTQPNVAKALRDTATAADLARARHIGLAQAAFIVAKVEGGNTTLLRRQGIQVAKNAKAEEALAVLRARVAGQAEAGATEQERFGAILHTTEEIIGQGVLPTLNEYLQSGGAWLEQMNESGKLQRDVATGADAIEAAVSGASTAIHDIDVVTGSFKNTLELLLALKVGSVLAGWATSLGLFSSAAVVAEGEAVGLRAQLAGLAAINPIVIPISLAVAADRLGHGDPLGLGNIKSPTDIVGILTGRKGFLYDLIAGKAKPIPVTIKTITRIHAIDMDHPLVPTDNSADAVVKRLTATQRNTFFDNEVARILLRGGLGNIQAQIDALVRADRLIAQRLKVTKDVTRRLNLEDQLLQNQAQIAQLRASAANDAKQAADEARQKFLDSLGEATAQAQYLVQVAQATKSVNDDIPALLRLQAAIEAQIRAEGRTADLETQLFENRQAIAAARAQQITGRQFVALGLTATGEQRIPGVQALRRALGNVQDEIIGSSLDTKKTRSLLASIRRVLSGGLGAVGEEVRAKIQKILGDLNRQLDDSTTKNLTKWKHLSSQAILAGVPDLTATQRRQLELRLSTLGPGNSVPPRQTQAFALAGGRTTQSAAPGDVYMDGEKVGTITRSHQIKRGRKRTVPRSG